MELSFGEQVKIVLRRKGMTIKELAEEIERQTGMKMSRQNLTQRLMRDNFQERDMRMIAAVLDCSLHLSIMEEIPAAPAYTYVAAAEEPAVSVEKAMKQELTLEQVAEEARLREEKKQAEEAAAKAAAEKAQADRWNEAARQAKEEAARLAEKARQDEERARREEEARHAREEARLQEEARKAEEARMAEENKLTPEELEALLSEEEQERARIRGIAQRAVEASQKSENSFLGNHRIDYVSKQQSQKQQQIDAANQAARRVRGESLVQAAKRDAETQAVLSHTADMGVIPDSFRSISRGNEPRENAPEINPGTGEEYESNVVRNHPRLKGYIQVYDRGEHRWIDMTEWAFLGFQEKKKVMLGGDYKPPIYLD